LIRLSDKGEAQVQSKTASRCEQRLAILPRALVFAKVWRSGPMPPPHGKYKLLRALSYYITSLLAHVPKKLLNLLDLERTPSL
jgi:hypothetical protein